jgi:AcrR family transcriptional regulator
MKDIAAEAGVSTGVIYHYFKNKEDLLLEVLKESFRRSHQQVMETVEPLTSPKDKLERHMDEIHRVPMDNPEFLRVLVNYLGEAKYHAEIEHILVKFFRNLRSYIDRYLQDGVGRGEVHGERIRHVSTVVYSFGLGLGLMGLLDPTVDVEGAGRLFKEMVRVSLFSPEQER